MSDEPLDIQTSSGTFEIPMTVRWGEMDAMRHINNVAYFRYFEEARVRLFMALGLGMAQGRDAVLAHASCDFLKPLLYPADIVVSMKLLRIGRSSVEFDCWIAPADDPRMQHARGRSVVVCVDSVAGWPVPWTDADRLALARCFSV